MGGHHHARDAQPTSVWRLIRYILTLKSRDFYGEVSFRVRAGEPVGALNERRDILLEHGEPLTDLEQSQVTAAVKSVQLS